MKKALPKDALKIWVAAFNAALVEYKDDTKAFQTAWAAVKNKFEKDSDGNWKPKKERSVMDEQASLPMLTRGAASFVPSSINEADRTVDLVWSTGADVRRQGLFSGPFVERLDMSDEAVDLSRLNNGANLLDSHNSMGGIRNVLGVVVDGSAEVKGPKGRRQGRATVRFSNRQDVEPVWNDVKAGILRNISVGYSVDEWERIDPPAAARDQTPVMLARRWCPQEISLVSVPADAGAQVRSGAPEFPCVIHRADPDPLLDAPLPYPPPSEEQEPMALAASRAAEKAAEEPKDQEQNAPGQATPNPPMDVNERPADPKTSVNEGPAPQVKPGTAPAVDPGTGQVEDGAPSSQGPAQVVVNAPVNAPANPSPAAQPEADKGERSAPVMLATDAVEIVRAATVLGLDVGFATEIAGRSGMTLDRARALLIDAKAQRQEPTQVNPVNVVSVRDEAETRAAGIRDAMLHRFNPTKFPLQGPSTEVARRFFGMPLLHMARLELENAGYRNAWSMPIAEAADLALRPGYGVRQGGYLGVRAQGGLHTTSDFASALLDVVHKTARQAYEDAPQTYQLWARRALHRDYRLYNSIQVGGLGSLQRVREHGEYSNATLSDSKEAYAVAKYGAIVGITREVIVNDDLGVFTNLPAQFGRAARNTESDIVYSVLLANAAMSDGTTLFHSAHGNLAGSAGAPSITTVTTAFSDMAVQKDPDGKTYLNLMPRYILVPPLLRGAVSQVLGNIVPAQSSNVVPDYITGLVPIAEARLQGGVTIDGTTYSGSSTAWFVVADPGQIAFVEYAYLEGGEGVFTETQQGFEIDGLKVKVRLDFGAKSLDWRGGYKNAG